LRQRELANIAELAEPLLLRITEGADFSATDRTAAMLLEAEIRDRLRAQRLAVAALVKVCRAARVRGVVVLLLDDGGPFAPAIADTVVDVIIRAVSGAVRGRVTVRLEPAGRERLGTILLDDGLISERIDL
jgi:predicted transcriptional regulator